MAATTMKQKLLLIVGGLFAAVLFTEILMRSAGYVLHFLQLHRPDYKTSQEGSGKEFRILTLGESTTADLFDGQDSWPAFLEQMLSEKFTDCSIQIINEGEPGVNTAFIAKRLKNHLETHRPQMVITMMGVNDEILAFRFQQGSLVGKVSPLSRFRVVKLAKMAVRKFPFF